MSTPSTLERNDEAQIRPNASPGVPGKEPKRRWWLWLLALAVLAFGAYRVHKGMVVPQAANSSPAGGAPGRNFGAVPVVAAQANKGDIGVYFTGLGAVTPIYTVTVKSQIAGYLMQVLYREGQIVQKGEALAEIDPRPYQVMLENAEAGLARDQANLANAKVDLNRYQTLVPLRAVPEQQLATQDALVKSEEGIVKTDQAQIDAAKLDLVYCHITAPITGRVGLRLVDPGNFVSPTDATGLVVITQIEPISVIFTLPEDQLPAIMQRMHAGARLRVDAFDREMTKKIAQGWLDTIDNQIDPTTGTVKLRANFDNRDGALFPNQFVNAKLLVEEKAGVTLIPTAGVQRNSQRTYVFLVKPDSTVTVRTITIGTTEGDESEVTSGLAPGDVVVMTGVDRLQEGTKVRFQKTKQQ
jgi:membrane fusion protein, multidrug efflux system